MPIGRCVVSVNIGFLMRQTICPPRSQRAGLRYGIEYRNVEDVMFANSRDNFLLDTRARHKRWCGSSRIVKLFLTRQTSHTVYGPW